MTGKLQKIKYLKAGKGQILGQLQRLRDFGENLTTEEDRKKFLIKFKQVPESKSQFSQLVDQICEALPDVTCLDDLDDLCTEIACLAEPMSTEPEKGRSPPPTQRKFKHLPELPLPTFAGEIKTWLLFKESFENLIHNNQELSDVEKINYLIGCLKGKALSVGYGVPPVGDNYQILWQILKEKYDDQRNIASSYLNEILAFKPLLYENLDNLNVFLENFHTNVEALKRLNFSDLGDFILAYLAFSKLPPETQKLFENVKRNSKIFSYNELILFVKSQQKICLRAKSGPFQTKINGKTNFVKKEKIFQNYVVLNKENFKCLLCVGKEHALFQCPQFLKMNPKQRYEVIRKNKRCLNCLLPHFIQKCRSSRVCKICQLKHNTLLHFENKNNADSQYQAKTNQNHIQLENKSEEIQVNEIVSMISCSDSKSLEPEFFNKSVLLSTVSAVVFDRVGSPHRCRFLLDSGSQSNFLSLEFCKRLNLKFKNCQIEVLGLGSADTKVHGCLDFVMAPHFDLQKIFVLDAFVIKRVVSRLPSANIDRSKLSYLNNIRLADPHFHIPQPIDGILGAEIFAQIVKSQKIFGPKHHPIGLETELGFVVTGAMPVANNVAENYISHAFCSAVNPSLNSLLQKFWEVEGVSSSNNSLPESKSQDEQNCEKLFVASHVRTESGRYMVKLPFKRDPKLLGDSFENAFKKFLSLEKKFENDSSYHKKYSQIIQDYLVQNHLTEIDDKNSTEPNFYIPHHAICKEESISTPLRIVFDASSKTTSTYSLNDLLHTGPKLQADICVMFLKFRTWKVAFTADIQQMYRQIFIFPEDRLFQKILWRFSPNEPLKIYQLNTVTFGVKSSPYLALRVLKQLAEDEQDQFPEASSYIKNDMYVDDLVSGSDSPQAACNLFLQLNELMKKGGFSLRKWATNDQILYNFIPQELLYHQNIEFHQHSLKLLRIMWNQTSDNFYFNIRLGDKICTKRNVLSTIARCYDPLGFLSPAILFGKLIIKSLWSLHLDWDELPPKEIVDKWDIFYTELPLLSEIKIPRFLNTGPETIENCLIGFADACTSSYGAMIYLKTINKNNEINVNFIYAKSKIAPSKVLTVPKLELCAALLLAKMLNFILQCYQHKIQINKIFSLSDSTIVLNWLRKNPNKLDCFVSNRVALIKTLIPEDSWFYINSKQNACDVLSRGQTPSQFKNNSTWFTGPLWLISDSIDWPITNIKNIKNLSLEKDNKETVVALPAKLIDENSLFTFMERQSNFLKMLRSMTYILKFGKLSHDLSQAECALVKIIQNKFFPKEIELLKNGISPTNLSHLRPFIKDSLIRVGGRLEFSDLDYEQKHPILLPKKCHFVDLLIDYYHQTNFHTGPHLTLALIRSKYWILAGRDAVRLRLLKCNFCFRFKPRNTIPVMGNLPPSRIQQIKPFLKSGVDYAGPIHLIPYRKRGVRSVKAYICIFVCMATKAVHIELVTDLSTHNFLQAFRRFLSRRGPVLEIFSDNGTNFLGAKAELNNFSELILSSSYSQSLKKELTQHGIKWHLIPPHAPHMGGLWESQVKVIKNHLFKGIKGQFLTYEEMNTLLIQIEAILNSRPLCALSSDPSDPTALTPAHFLGTGPLEFLPWLEFTNDKLSRSTRYRLLDNIIHSFWKRWHREYLSTLLPRTKWHKDTPHKIIQKGTVALIEIPNTPPLHWPLGVVQETHPGKDNIVRVVTVKTGKGEFKRPITKVYPLPNQ